MFLMNVMIVIDSTDPPTNGTMHERTNEHRVAAAEEGLPPVIMFAFDSYFPAVAATDLLVSRSNSNSTRKENVQIGTGSGCCTVPYGGTARRVWVWVWVSSLEDSRRQKGLQQK